MTIKNYINGAYCMPSSQDWLDVINPSVGEIYGQLPNSNREDVQLAYEAAKKHFQSGPKQVWKNEVRF